jgi:hypothetical protein
MVLTKEQNAELKKHKWNKVNKVGDDCVWIELYADETHGDTWETLCRITGHDMDDSSVKLLIIGEA